MATKLIHKKSSVIEKVPLTTDLEVGEIAINLADKKLFTKDASDNIISLGNTEESKLPIKADVALSKGDVLYATGTVGASGKISVNKFIANNTIEELYLVGVAEKDFALGDTGFAITFGEIKNINTTGSTVGQTWVDGTILYSSPSTAGELTNVKPTAPNQSISVAIVIRAHATTGILFVRPLVGFHLNELHDVYIPSPTDGQVLAWNAANSRWQAATAYTDADVDTHLNTITATTGEVLSWTGTDYDWIAAGGGGGTALELYAENPVTLTAPSATGTNAVAIGSGAFASGENAVAFANSIASGFNSFAGAGDSSVGTGARASYSIALGYQSKAQSNFQVMLGQAQGGTGANNAAAIGWAYAGGTDSFAAAITNNTATYGANATSSVAIGKRSKASGSYAFASGGYSTASGVYSAAIGYSSTASNTGSFALGTLCSSTASYSYALGYQSSADRHGKFALSGKALSGVGSSQTGILVLMSDTTDATTEALTANNSAPGITNQVILPNNSAYAFHGTIVARQDAASGTACAAWKIVGLIRREGSAGTTVLVNSATTVLDNTPAWGMALSADTTYGGLKIEVTGAAATNIRWVATIHTSEVTY